MGTDIDVAVGANVENEMKLLDGKVYKFAPFGPYLLGQIINFIKKRKRAEIAATAKEFGETSLVTVNEVIVEELAKITEETIDEQLSDMEVMTHLVFYNLQVYQPTLTYLDMGKLFDVEKITEACEFIMVDVDAEKNPKMPDNAPA